MLGVQDVCMPVMDGLEATWRIRKYEETGFWVDAQDGKANRIVGGDSDEFPPDVRFADAPPPRNLPRQRTPIIAVCPLSVHQFCLYFHFQGTKST